ncbi:MAG: hypothetical protein C4547_10385 [Phycisphaerales bacterium]|nr:MAG: hypothetical protein C4547_10385 [Phycisphaerales bacterium]
MIDPHELDVMLGGAWHPDLHPLCTRCGYDLTGSVSDRCPECGGSFSRRQIEREAYALKNRIRQLDFVPGVIDAGMWVCAVGAVLSVPVIVFNAWLGVALPFLARGLAWGCGCTGFLMAMSCLQALRIPPWARSKLKTPIDFRRAVMAMMLGGGQIATAILVP